jgi:predicted metal-binding membrane protein
LLFWGGLLGIVAASWAWLAWQAWAMEHMDIVEMAMPSRGSWGAPDLLLVFTMWAVMMAAMMLPSAVPMILAYATISRQRSAARESGLRPWAFVGGYLAVWTVFSLLATLAQWGMHELVLRAPALDEIGPLLGGVLLIAAGVYQWTPAKRVCLAQCRSPFDFLLTSWRDGAWGALRMGVVHGAYCVGCCWLLMLLLFAVGVMNMTWIALLSVLVLLEKATPQGGRLARGAGVLLVAWGGWMALSGLI